MYKRVLVPLDGSKAAEIALPYAKEITAKFGADFCLVSVSEPGRGEEDHLYQAYLDRVLEQVRGQLEEWGAKEKGELNRAVLTGRPANEILRYADETNVDLIVMTGRGRTGSGPWVLGNVAAKVLRATVKPVLLVKVAADSAALQQRKLIKRILLPLDGSKVGEAAIPLAEELAKILVAEIILLRALLAGDPAGGWDATMYSPRHEEEEEHRRESAMTYLNDVRDALEKKGLRVSSAVTMGLPPDQILDYSEANAVDLIAMSTHGRSGIGRWVFGSVTDKVLHAGEIPVLVVRAAK
jgi:nucleotide-binding universal stress UspA family protein